MLVYPELMSNYGCLAMDQEGLLVAARNGHVARVQELLASGADVEQWGDWQARPLHEAAKNGSAEAVAVLLRAGAQVNARDGWQETPLHFAAYHGHLSVAELLVQAGADVNMQNISRNTPLHIIINNEHVAFAKLLLEHGANQSLKNNIDQTPCEKAVCCGYKKIAKYLTSLDAASKGAAQLTRSAVTAIGLGLHVHVGEYSPVNVIDGFALQQIAGFAKEANRQLAFDPDAQEKLIALASRK